MEHLVASLDKHGVYRNVVIAREGTLLAGHGVWRAAQEVGLTRIPVVRLDVAPNEPAAWQVLIGDNEIARLAVRVDGLLTQLLQGLAEEDAYRLMGTGFDPTMLAGLQFVTRPASEVLEKDEMSHWVGMPEYGEPDTVYKLVINCHNGADRARCIALLNLPLPLTGPHTQSSWWPPKEREDIASVRFEG
jgi:hypothetical protein